MVTAFREYSPSVHNSLSGTQLMRALPVLAEIESYQYLEFGWDGEDAIPLLDTIGAKATQFILIALNAYKQSYSWHNVSWVDPEASPTVDGGLDLVWNINGRTLNLFFNPNGSIEVLVRYDKKVIGTFVFHDSDKSIESLIRYVGWVLGVKD